MSGRCVHRFNPELERRRCISRGGRTRVQLGPIGSLPRGPGSGSTVWAARTAVHICNRLSRLAQNSLLNFEVPTQMNNDPGIAVGLLLLKVV